LFACSSADSSQTKERAPSEAPQPTDAGADDDLESRLQSLDLNPQDDAEETLWKDAETFKLSFQAGGANRWLQVSSHASARRAQRRS
jgi:hypothetical protein